MLHVLQKNLNSYTFFYWKLLSKFFLSYFIFIKMLHILQQNPAKWHLFFTFEKSELKLATPTWIIMPCNKYICNINEKRRRFFTHMALAGNVSASLLLHYALHQPVSRGKRCQTAPDTRCIPFSANTTILLNNAIRHFLQ